MMRNQEPGLKAQSMSERLSESRIAARVLAGVAASAIVVTGCEAPSDKNIGNQSEVVPDNKTTESHSEITPNDKTIENQSKVAAEEVMETLEVSDIYDFQLVDAEVEAKPYASVDLSTGKEADYTVIDVNLQRDKTPEYAAAAKEGKFEGVKLKDPVAYSPEWYTLQYCGEDEVHEVRWLEGLNKKSTVNGQQPRTGNDIFFIERNDDEGTHRIAINANKLQSAEVNIELRYVINPIVHAEAGEPQEDHELSIQKVGDVTFNIENGKVTDVAVDPVDQ